MTRRLVAAACLEIVRRGDDSSRGPAPAWRDRRVEGGEQGSAIGTTPAVFFRARSSASAIAGRGQAADRVLECPRSGPQTLGAHSPRNATSARFFKALGGTIRAELAGNDRTFGCRRRHMGVGDFSAQYLNGRRQAMIFRLRGVALFNDQFVAYQPSGNGRYGQTRWLSLAGLGGSEPNVLTRGAAGVERSARRRHAHCKFIVVAPGRSIFLKNSLWFKIANACRKRRTHSQIVHAV